MRLQSQNDPIVRLRNRVVLFFLKRCGFHDNSNFGDLPRKFESTTHSFYYFVESFHTSAGSLSFSLYMFTDSKFIFARASSVIAFLSGMSIIWIWIVTLCYCLIACIACACFLCVHSIPTHLFLYFVFVSALVSVCVAVCVSTYRKCGIG